MTFPIRIFDIETTGIDAREDRIIEVAAYDLNVDATIRFAGGQLCDPGRSIPPGASAVHHLTDAEVSGRPLFGAIWPLFNDQSIKIYAAHNCEFEKAFLPTPEGVHWVCTYKCALHAWPDAPGHSNQVLRYWLGIDKHEGFDRAVANLAHRAGPDAYVTAYLLAELLAKHDLSDLLRWTVEPKAYATLTFGKHRGAKWADVPFDYLQWLRDGRHEMDADWRHGAKVELERRQGGAR